MGQDIVTDDILLGAPDFVQVASAEQQNIYIDYETKRRLVDTCPDRFLTYKGGDGELKVIDLKFVNVRGIMMKNGASEEDIRDAREIKDKIMHPLIQDFRHAKVRYMNCFDLYNDKRKALAKLTPLLLDLFGSMHSTRDVKKIIKSKEGYDLGEEELIQFYNENKSLIENRQQKFVIKSDRYRVATEAGRLEIINDMLTDMLLKYEYYVDNEQDGKALNLSREIRNLLEQARKEVKGNELKLTVDGKIDITATLHGQENIARVMREIPINSIIVGLVAAKSGIKPEVLISQLNSSWYKDFNGFGKNILGQEKIELPGDMIKGYDWERIQEQNSQFLQEMSQTEDAEYEEVTESKKQILLERLKKLKS